MDSNYLFTKDSLSLIIGSGKTFHPQQITEENKKSLLEFDAANLYIIRHGLDMSIETLENLHLSNLIPKEQEDVSIVHLTGKLSDKGRGFADNGLKLELQIKNIGDIELRLHYIVRLTVQNIDSLHTDNTFSNITSLVKKTKDVDWFVSALERNDFIDKEEELLLLDNINLYSGDPILSGLFINGLVTKGFNTETTMDVNRLSSYTMFYIYSKPKPNKP